jgi:hypothetical protein
MDRTADNLRAVKRSEIEELLKDDLAFRDELIADRDSAKERAKAEYLRAWLRSTNSPNAPRTTTAPLWLRSTTASSGPRGQSRNGSPSWPA